MNFFYLKIFKKLVTIKFEIMQGSLSGFKGVQVHFRLILLLRIKLLLSLLRYSYDPNEVLVGAEKL